MDLQAWAAAVEHNTLLALLLTFVAAASESLVVVGAFIPGTAFILLLGAAAGAGILPLWPLVAAAIAGAITGDGISYRIGHRYRHRILNLRPFSSHPHLFEVAEGHLRQMGWIAVLVARFLPGIRAVVPVAAGITGMRPAAFYGANVISAVLWALAHILPAAAAGLGLGRAHGLTSVTGIELLAAAAIVVLLIWFAHLRRKRTMNRTKETGGSGHRRDDADR